MDVIFEGALSKSWGMKDVLKAISDVPNVPVGVLRVSNPGRGIQGKILVSQAQHVVGAVCSGTQAESDPYEALRTLLEVQEGNFAFLDFAGEAPAEFDQSLFICIKRVLDVMPQLPAHASDMFDQRALLDRVFGEDCAPADATPVEAADSFAIPKPILRSRRASSRSIKKSASAPITQWNIVEPLFNNPQANHTEHTECCSMIPEFVQTPDEQRSSMNRLRTLPGTSRPHLSWEQMLKQPQPIKWLLAALGLSMAICFVTPQMWGGHTVKSQQPNAAVIEPAH